MKKNMNIYIVIEMTKLLFCISWNHMSIYKGKVIIVIADLCFMKGYFYK